MPHVLDAATVLSVDRQLSWHDYAEAVRAGKDLGEVALLVHPETLPPGPVCTYPGIGYAALDDLLRDGLATRRDGGAVVIGPLRLVVTIADGGLDVDTSLRVLDRAGQPIDGLYACGSAALGDVKLEGHGHHLLWAAGTGWLAGGSIADRMKH
jgi:fumarate reductase flavoprotein subunit